MNRLAKGALAALTLGAVVLAAACGASDSSETTYWRARFAGGTTLYMSLQTDGTSAAGWAQYADGKFQHFTGTRNSDGTIDVSAYTGRTLTMSGDSMTATSYRGADHWVKVSESEFKTHGGPTETGNQGSSTAGGHAGPAEPSRAERAVPDGPGAQAEALYHGIPQSSTALGEPDAPTTVRIYCDYQSPFCADTFRKVVPVLVKDGVRSGKLKLDLRVMSFVGPDSTIAAHAASRAAEEDRLWQFSSLFYTNQLSENSGYVTENFIREINHAAAVSASGGSAERADVQLAEVSSEAERAGVVSAPSLTVSTGGGDFEKLDVNAADPAEVSNALDRVGS